MRTPHLGRGDLKTLGRELEPEPTAAELQAMKPEERFRAAFTGPAARNRARLRLIEEEEKSPD